MKYKEIAFNIENDPYCCGLFIVGNYEEVYNRWSGGSVLFSSRKAQFKAFDEALKETLADAISFDGTYPGGYLLQTTLVTKYRGRKSGQFPALAKHLIETGWNVNMEWKNANTGNTITQYQKLLTNEETKELRKISDDTNDDW